MKPRGSGRQRRWRLNTVLVAVSLCGALLATELAVRFLAPQPTGLSHQDRYGLVMHYPGITRYLPQYGHSVTFNRAWMRDREHQTAKPAGTFRILLLGDSFMEAFQVPFEASFASLLESRLSQATGATVEVINAGVSGWGTDDQLRYLVQYGIDYEPDLVVVAMTLHNDISDNLRRQWHTLEGDSLVSRDVAQMPYWQYKKAELKAFLSTRFQLYQLWRRVSHRGEIRQVRSALDSHIVQLFREPPPEGIASGFRLTELLLAEIKSTAQGVGAPTALFLLPLKVQLSDSIYAAFVQSAGATEAEMPAARPQRVMVAIADSLQIPVIDLLPAFVEWTATSDTTLYMVQDGHWNEAGHRLAAAIVAQGLIDAGLVP